MYARRIQLLNYGPIAHLDIQFPFDGDEPKPVVLVGENGSGKSIVLSHIVNGLLAAKSSAFPETPEVDNDKVYKLRSDAYIRSGAGYYLALVQFDQGMVVGEVRAAGGREAYPHLPDQHWSAALKDIWQKVPEGESDHFESSFPGPPPFGDNSSRAKIRQMLSNCCVLFFPFNRFEEPAWLNEDNLSAKAQHVDVNHIADSTDRTIISTSPLRENQNWLYDVVYDRAVFEIQTPQFRLPIDDNRTALPVSLFAGYRGGATSMFDVSLQVIRHVVGRNDVRYGIGTRHNRVLSLESESGFRVSNVFQLSSGESVLLNLFLSVLRDYDLSGAAFSAATDIRGIVVIDEVDLHLHVRLQRTVLPTLMRMFRNVQFVVTTHSPLFVLGMRDVYGEDGFEIYRLPEGNQIDAEEFGEFEDAYEALMETQRARVEVKEAVEASQRPIVFVEGRTDKQYLERAATVLGRHEIWEKAELRVGGSDSKLDTIWKAHANVMGGVAPVKIVLLYDCDAVEGRGGAADQGNVSRRFMPLQGEHLIRRGIENLFSRHTLEKARSSDPELFEITPEHAKSVGSEGKIIPERWVVRSDSKKRELCNLICSEGESADFDAFEDVFEAISEAAGLS